MPAAFLCTVVVYSTQTPALHLLSTMVYWLWATVVMETTTTGS
ncbi:unnamed protein product [Acanthoscelides obtectus]|uniref:Uncharacterized protein n=1 Tax=Acanthoscelides obtectus TaxID=200917 RepID=A0A9P0KBN8_ACAOB|nr:unnamed protein product [Acanthoscelides obtectus]CAK1649302.1 hypothetical protein AOBTE_LOCUS16139 [Acanthoscelides obtectus]